ncbi:MAG: glycerol-3-phosphate 1-O-acyltransferase PlsY [Planctomycetota bacterium]
MTDLISDSSFLTALLCSYLIGSIPFSYIIARLNGVDLLKVGSGNPGATNLSRNLGKKLGAIGLGFDLLKGVVPVFLSEQFHTGEHLPVLFALAVGAAAIVGHCFSPFLLGKGGKGVATTAGVLLAYEPWLAISMLVFWGGVLMKIRSVGISSVVAALGGALLGATMMAQVFSFGSILINSGSVEDQRRLGLTLVIICLLIVIRHRSNIREYREARSAASS